MMGTATKRLYVDYRKVMGYLNMNLDLDNESPEYGNIAIKEFREMLEQSTGTKVYWRNKP